jgi:5-methylcytosine-specific restriction enzyme A
VSPSRPLRPCTQSGCPRLVSGGRCEEHARVRKHDPNQRRFYSSARWRQLAELVRRQQPICTVCERAPSTQAHHRDGDWRNNAADNLAGICAPCHARESGRAHREKRG